MLFFNLTEGTLKKEKYSLFFNPFFTWKEKGRRKKGEKGILKRRISWIFSIPSVKLKWKHAEPFPFSRNFQARLYITTFSKFLNSFWIFLIVNINIFEEGFFILIQIHNNAISSQLNIILTPLIDHFHCAEKSINVLRQRQKPPFVVLLCLV